MNFRKLWFVVGLLLVSSVSVFAGDAPTIASIEARFGKLMRNTKIVSIKESPVPGLYEVIAGPNVMYYSPAGEGYFVFGQIVDNTGVNVTAPVAKKLREEHAAASELAAAEKIKNAPLELAVKIGSGPNVVIEFTDPDCPYCRRLDRFLSARKDITRYVFLFPIDQLHPNARAKSLYIYASEDKEKALREVFEGRFDKEAPVAANTGEMEVATKRLEEGMRLGRELGVQGTPLLFVNGKMVNGADESRIISFLKKDK